MRSILEYVSLVFVLALIGGAVSALTGFLARFLTSDLLLGWRWLGLLGSFFGFVMGLCSVMRAEGVGSFMTNQQVLGATMYTYRDKVIESNWFDYVSFFSAFALFIVDLWAFNPAMESGTFLSDVMCLVLAGGGAAAVYLAIRVLFGARG
jgi:hypothetical protein